MKKAAIYLRVSTTDQNYDRQEVELRTFAKMMDFEIIHVFEEKKSAVLKMDIREQLSEMRKLTKDDVDRIFIWDITRLSRRAIDFINLVNEFAEKGICLHFKERNIITLGDDGKLDALTGMYLYLLGVFAQMDAENRKAMMKSGKENALLKGHSYTNIAPFGYYLENKHLYIKEEEAKYVKQAFELYRDGKDTQYIADIFNANRVPLKSRRKDIVWVKGTISQLLKNTVYYGKGKLENIIKKKTEESPVEKKIRYFDAPAIIGKELYDECRNRAILNRSQQDKSKEIITLLRGLLVCGVCGKFYVIGNNNKQREYRDGDIRANVNNRVYCKNGSIKAEIADFIVWEAVKDVYTYNTFKEKCLEEKEKCKLELFQNETTILELQKDIANIIAQINRLGTAYLKELFSDEEFAEQKSSLISEKLRLEGIINEYKAKNLLLNDIIVADYDFSKYLIRDLSLGEKKEVCNQLIETILIYNYGTNRRLLHVKLKIGLRYNILVCTVSANKSYCIVDDATVTFNNPFKAPEIVRDLVNDFSVTSNNNNLFNEEIFGEYSYEDVWNIMDKYGYVKKLSSTKMVNN
ncbi:hypothetical protein C799_00730 [Bacteroides thetaiotaomicron dnLKV9]|jgi:resolvase, N domain protein|uniref:Resolvase/invertase-type recombinase catalytic domain-containing protein n=1 Tax=Bacteroides thetaiotaomicron dnLKV9 TaxID=1235785 RepID=R9HF63_BACT4|nr:MULTISPECIES: recombinase family protein [Bacteroides]EOS02678.1 hypothetical protein C799_00730 [Bacteroides thetaiotaomicron dnLKV9]MCM0680932.1 recombinase family protein [Bacteroides sp. B1-V-101]MCS2955023.1 recombinase family protein [Bacteroides thetaiotaomicron]